MSFEIHPAVCVHAGVFSFYVFFFLYTSKDICLKGFGINHLGPCLCCLAIRFCSVKKYSTFFQRN